MSSYNNTSLVTGGFGFIGSELVRQLLNKGDTVIVYDNLSFGRESNLPEHDNLHVVIADLSDVDRLREMIRTYSPSNIYHLAAIHFIPYCNKHPQETIDVNVTGTWNVLEASKEIKVKSFAYASTAAVYGIKDLAHSEDEKPNPVDIYGASKLFGEHLVRMFHRDTGIQCTIARLFNGYGRRETNPHVIPEILDQLAKSNTISLGNTEPKRDFIHTSDIARAFREMSGSNNYDLEVFNVGTGHEISVKEIVEVISEILERPIEIINEESRKRKVERYHLVPDISRIKEKLGWQPKVSLRDGFLDLLESVGLIN